MGLIELKCPNCGSELQPDDVFPQIAAARCRHCDTLFAIPAGFTKVELIRRPEVTLPARFQISHDIENLVIRRRWYSPIAFVLLFFAIFWNGFMVVWHGIALGSGMWIMSAFGLIHTAVGLGLIYFVLAIFLNSTVITANKFQLSVSVGPLPWKGNRRIDSSQVRQLFCKEKISRRKNGTSSSYSVEAVMQDNSRQTLANGFANADEALFVEQQLEKHLGLADIKVEGEHGR
jgi:hypothetical protein